jgi:hypothetical protein
MMLTMAEEERRDLTEVLDGHLREMLLEIARTDDRDYRDDLRRRYERLERVHTRLCEAAVTDELYV